jgi:hypothetical protein
MGHNLVLLDINLSPELADFFPQGDAVLTTQFGLQPRADDMDVIDLANERHSILVTADQGFIRKCRIWQEQQPRMLVRPAASTAGHRTSEADFGRHQTPAKKALSQTA